MAIRFLTDELRVPFAQNEPEISAWLAQIIKNHSYTLNVLHYTFCSDRRLLEMNQTFLKHDYYTDILTFDYSDKPQQIEGEVFISADRIKENAETYRVTFENEKNRLLAHGLLHLLGFKDQTTAQKKEMKEKEEMCLGLLEKTFHVKHNLMS